MRQPPTRPAPITSETTVVGAVALFVLSVALLAACSSARVAPAAPPAAAATSVPPATVVTGSGPVETAPADAAPGSSALDRPAPDESAVVPTGFARVAARAVTRDGEVCELCLWLADDGHRRRRGLMYVTDLGPADGMAFRYDDPTTRSFWMRNTVLPLSIVFFSADGQHLGAFDMEPCTTPSCPRYRTPDDFLVAVEVERGRLGELGLGDGSTLELLDEPCP